MTSVDVLAAADCEEVLVLRDRRAEAVAIIALHDTSLGPAHGGIRRLPYPDLAAAAADVVALAQAMSRKCALAEVAAGGGKAVLVDHPGLDVAAGYRLIGRAVERLAGRFFTGPDVGTSIDDLRVVESVTSSVATGDPDRGPGDLAVATATGVAAAIGALAERLALDRRGLVVNVQGLGAVGMQLCHLLHADGAVLRVCDPVAARAAAARDRFAAEVVPVGDLSRRACDVFAPCALGGVIDDQLAAELPARGVCGAANNIFAASSAAATLHDRGVLAVPDFVANAGALVLGASFNLGQPVGLDRVRRIGRTAGQILDDAKASGEPPATVALRIADERLAAARARRNEEA